MSTLAANNITDAAGTGGPTLANGLTIGTSLLAAPSGSAPSYTCRAWVNFNGTGTVAIREDGNVTNITDNGTGLYTVNFTNALADTNYAVVYCGGDPAVSASVPLGYTRASTTSGVTFSTYSYSSGALFDSPLTSLAIFR